jgi:hypothetical protein
MKILVFRMDFAGKKWKEYLPEEFGEETAEKFSVESHRTAKMHDAKISILNFDGDSELINKIKNHDNVSSAYLIKQDKEHHIKLNRKEPAEAPES